MSHRIGCDECRHAPQAFLERLRYPFRPPNPYSKLRNPSLSPGQRGSPPKRLLSGTHYVRSTVRLRIFVPGRCNGQRVKGQHAARPGLTNRARFHGYPSEFQPGIENPMVEYRPGFVHEQHSKERKSMSNPIELHYWPTPNGWKISIALEELELPYTVHLVNIGAGDQFEPEFLKIAPNNRMPAIVDPDGPGGTPISVFESGAILQYLGRKTGRFYGSNERERVEIEQWLMWQMGGVGPMAGQAHHFLKYAPSLDPPQDLPYAQDRYRSEVSRLYGVLDRRLADRDYIAGNYSIADMAIWPWASLWEGQQQDIASFPNMSRWLDKVAARPAVQAGRKLAEDNREICKRTKRRKKSCSENDGKFFLWTTLHRFFPQRIGYWSSLGAFNRMVRAIKVAIHYWNPVRLEGELIVSKRSNGLEGYRLGAPINTN